MCGIAGFCRFDGQSPDEALLQRMVSAIQTRGPDGQGLHVQGPVALGHRRLSIIDLEGGHQPMFNEDASVAVTFNGEIYNFRALRRELEGRGHQFKTDHSDTEVIVHAWEEWGKDCVTKFRGMFAFCVADWNQRLLFLARDQLGIKPLVYENNQGRFAFASELQALKCDPEFDRSLDLQSLDQYLLLQYIPAPATIFQHAKKLPPAHRMLVHFDGQIEEPERYWDLHFEPEHGLSLEEWKERLDAAMRESVQAHLVADVPFGAFLSGGMDSTAVTGIMSQLLDKPVKAFSIGFGEEEFNEVPYARQAAARWGVEHIVEQVEPDALSILPNLVQHYGEPFGDASAIPTYYVSKLARQQVPMILSGDGGDEAMAGYSSYYGWMKWLEAKPFPRPLWKKLARPVLSALFPFRFPPDPSYKTPHMYKWIAQIVYCWQELRQELWLPEYQDRVTDTIPAFQAAFSLREKDYAPLQLAQFTDYRTYLPNDILTKVDVASMMHGLEVRTPFVDRIFLDTTRKIPWDVNFHYERGVGFEGKRVLRAWLRDYFPEEFIDRRKMGFSVPLKQWFDPSKGALHEPLKERLLGSGSPLHDYFRPQAMERLIKEHNITRDFSPQLWLLFFLAEWLTQNQSSS